MQITHIDDVIWPKTSTGTQTRFGNMCYLANSEFTALDEKDVKHGENVIITRFVMLPNAAIKLFPAGEADAIVRAGKGHFTPQEQAEKIQGLINACTIENHHKSLAYVMQDSFLFEQLTSGDHVISGYALQGIFNKHKTRMDAVGYPSIKRRGGLNIGVVTDNFWNSWAILSISKARVRRLPFGYYDLIFLEHVSGIGYDGSLHWEKNLDKNIKSWLLLSPPYRPCNF